MPDFITLIDPMPWWAFGSICFFLGSFVMYAIGRIDTVSIEKQFDDLIEEQHHFLDELRDVLLKDRTLE